jgi:hypothetical protein
MDPNFASDPTFNYVSKGGTLTVRSFTLVASIFLKGKIKNSLLAPLGLRSGWFIATSSGISNYVHPIALIIEHGLSSSSSLVRYNCTFGLPTQVLVGNASAFLRVDLKIFLGKIPILVTRKYGRTSTTLI